MVYINATLAVMNGLLTILNDLLQSYYMTIYQDFIQKHNFGELEQNLLISILENSESAVILSKNISEIFKINLSLDQVEALRNFWYTDSL